MPPLRGVESRMGSEGICFVEKSIPELAGWASEAVALAGQQSDD